MRNEELLRSVKEERNILQTINKRKDNCIRHILCRNCLLTHVIEGSIKERMEVTGRPGRRIKQLLEGLTERRGYWELKKEALDRTL
jgi:hypothetical protein